MRVWFVSRPLRASGGEPMYASFVRHFIQSSPRERR